MKNEKHQNGSSTAEAIIGLSIVGWIVGSWFTHIVVCLAAGKWGFLIAGAILFPIAVIHGTGIWFGAF